MSAPSLPPSPFPDHAFLPFPEGGMLYNLVHEDDWIVIVQRDLTIRGPRPALCYIAVQHGLPTDIIGYHRIDAAKGEAIAQRQRGTDILRLAPRFKRDMTIGSILIASMLAMLAAATMRRA